MPCVGEGIKAPIGHNTACVEHDRHLREDVAVEGVAFEEEIDTAQCREVGSVAVAREPVKAGRCGQGSEAVVALGVKLLAGKV